MENQTMNIFLTMSLEKAKNGELAAQLFVAQCYLKGEGVAQDYIESAYWMEKAAKQGHAGACHNTAILYENGLGVEQDLITAISYYKKAADQGFVNSQRALGRLYADKDVELARYYLTLAVEQGDQAAETLLQSLKDN